MPETTRAVSQRAHPPVRVFLQAILLLLVTCMRRYVSAPELLRGNRLDLVHVGVQVRG